MSHRFLLQLDGLIRRDPHHPGFSGKLAVVVRAPHGDQCWLGAFVGHRARGELRSNLPLDLDALVLLDEQAADALAVSGRLPSDALARFAGNKALMQRFLDRYLKRNNFVGIRTNRGGSDGHAGRTSRRRASRAASSRRRPR